MTKAKKFQPLAVLNQKLRGLEVFEPNDETGPTISNAPRITSSGTASPVPPTATEAKQLDPEEVVTRAHWQRPTGYDSCSDPMCGKRLGGANGQIHCRHCGKLFCEEHTMYQMKLSRSAQHEPVRGLWCRVCETCYKSREGYNDHNGAERSHFDHFKAARRKTVDKQNLEISRLETRLTRLTQLLADPPPEPNQSAGNLLWSSISGAKPQLRALEQSVVAWEDDASVAECPFCQQAFSQYTFRRHHCRICGRVVCGDPATNCSNEIGLDVDTSKAAFSFFYGLLANVGQSLTISQKKLLARWQSMYACAKTVNAPYSARRILRENLREKRRISAPTETCYSSNTG